MAEKTKPGAADEAIGQNLRRMRRMRAITVQEIAAVLNVSEAQIYKYETGDNKLSASQVMTLSNFLRVKPQAILKGN